MCGAACESVVHVLWECPVYRQCRASFIDKLRSLLGDKYLDFESLDNEEKTAYVLGNELWESNFFCQLSLVKEFLLNIWELRKNELYGDDSCPAQPGSSAGDLRFKGGQTGKFPGKPLDCDVVCGQCGLVGDVCVCSGLCCSAHDRGCVADGNEVMAVQ